MKKVAVECIYSNFEKYRSYLSKIPDSHRCDDTKNEACCHCRKITGVSEISHLDTLILRIKSNKMFSFQSIFPPDLSKLQTH